VGSVAGEIKEPHKTYPRGLIIAVVLVIISYVWPLTVAVSVDHDYDKWYVGYYADITGRLGGDYFKIYTSLIGLASAIGLFNVRLCTASAALSALGPDIGWSKLGVLHNRFKTPWVSVIVNTIGITLLIPFNFQILVQIDVAFYALSLVVQFASLFWLRVKEPDLARPYKLPMNSMGIAIFIACPIALCLVLVVLTSTITKLVVLGVIVLGCIINVGIYWRNKKLAAGFSKLSIQEEEDESSVPVLHDEDQFSLDERRG